MHKEAFGAKFDAASTHLPGGSQSNHKNRNSALSVSMYRHESGIRETRPQERYQLQYNVLSDLLLRAGPT
jgi:hypothetical protein